MRFANPQMLWLLAGVVPLLGWFLWWAGRRKAALMTQFIQARLLPQLTVRLSARREKLRRALILLAVICGFVALARPQWGFRWEEATTRGLDIVVAIDTSRSMLARDIPPNRLTRAKLAALDLLRLAKQDRLGLVAFAGTAFLQCPLTLDDAAFRQNVELLDTSIIPQGGTALAEAIKAARAAFAGEEGDNFKVLVLFTDGEDHDSGALQAAKEAAQAGLIIYTIGVGTPEGELLQVTDESGQTSYVKDDAGNAVKSRLNERLLTEIATVANGFYLNLRGAKTMETLFEHERGLRSLPKNDIATKLVQQYYERFQWPLAFAVALLLAESLLPHPQRERRTDSRRERPSLSRGASERAVAGWRTAAMALGLLAMPAAVWASPASAHRSYKDGNYLTAEREYQRLLEKHPDDPRLRYNAGTAAYKARNYDDAVKAFLGALVSPDLPVQQRAYYNLGNALYRAGERAPELDAKVQAWQQAVRSYESALKLDPQDEDARFNLEFVKRKLEQLPQDPTRSPQRQNPKDDSKKDDQDQSPEQKPEDKSDQNSEPSEPRPEQPNQDQQAQNQQGQSPDQPDQKDAEQPSPQTAGQNGQDQGPEAESQAPAAAAQLGQMTPEQAVQLLEAQKGEERALIFWPEQRPRARTRVFKDW